MGLHHLLSVGFVHLDLIFYTLVSYDWIIPASLIIVSGEVTAAVSSSVASGWLPGIPCQPLSGRRSVFGTQIPMSVELQAVITCRS